MSPTGPFRVVVLTHVFPRHDGDPSGSFLSTWTEALRQAGHDVRVIAPHDAGTEELGVVGTTPVRRIRYADGPREVLAYRGEMHRIALRPPWGPPLLGAFATEMAAGLRRAVWRWRPDLVHVHWWLPGAVIARAAGVDRPLVVHLHGTDVGVVEHRPWLAGLARWALTPAGRVEAVSASLAGRTRTAIGVDVDGINPMPIALDRFAARALASRQDGRSGPNAGRIAHPDGPGGTPLVLGVGRLVPEKGFGDLVRAAGGLGREIRLRILGEGPDRPRLAALAHAGGVTLELPGHVAPTDLPHEYARADLVVQPSHGEGLGLVAAEALAAGRPVVATDSGGARDLLDRGSLVRPGDVGTLRARIVKALDDPDAGALTAATARVSALLAPEAAVTRTVEGWQATLDRHAGS